MSGVFYKGKLSMPMKPVAYMNCLMTWAAGNAQDEKLKLITQQAYNCEFSEHVSNYDELTSYHYEKVSNELLGEMDLNGKYVLDVGCGTGISSFAALEAGASKVTCADTSSFMLDKCREKFAKGNYDTNRIDFSECDAEALDFADESFDIVISNMLMGMAPDQEKIISEMARVLRSGGTLAFSAHGIEHNWEIAEMSVRTVISNPSLWGSNFFKMPPYYPRAESEYKKILVDTKLSDIVTRRQTWVDQFDSPEDAMNFILTTGAALPVSMFKSESKRERFLDALRQSYIKKDVNTVTHDVIYAYGNK